MKMKGFMMGWARNSNWRNSTCMQNLGQEMQWKEACWECDTVCGWAGGQMHACVCVCLDSVKTDLEELGCKDVNRLRIPFYGRLLP